MAPISPTTKPASGNAQAALASALPTTGVVRVSGSRVQKARLAKNSAVRSASQLWEIVMVRKSC
jgi:hypothetical protein